MFGKLPGTEKNNTATSISFSEIARPQVEYASTVWSPHTKKDIHKIEIVQRRAIRWTQNSYSTYASVTQMQNELVLRSLEQSLEQRRADGHVSSSNEVPGAATGSQIG